MTQAEKNILIVTGEKSGDLLGARLVSSLAKSQPHLSFYAMGGTELAKSCRIVVDSQHMGIVGFVEVIKHAACIRQAFKKVQSCIKQTKPALVILIDYPGFNLRIADFAKKAGCKVLYYVSPQVWAWHRSRLKKIKRSVDHMAVLFPFEKEFYTNNQVPVTYVGHPLAEELTFAASTKATPHKVALLPGSRQHEIKRLWPVICDSAKQLKQTLPDVQFILPLCSHVQLSIPEDLHDDILIVKENRYQAMQSCTAAIATSGTVTLELALLGVPTVIIYKTTAINYFLGKRFITIDHIGLPNIIANKTLFPEFIQDDANPENIVKEVLKWLQNSSYREQVTSDLQQSMQTLQHKNQHAEALCQCVTSLID